jgi:hypothetical protein
VIFAHRPRRLQLRSPGFRFVAYFVAYFVVYFVAYFLSARRFLILASRASKDSRAITLLNSAR